MPNSTSLRERVARPEAELDLLGARLRKMKPKARPRPCRSCGTEPVTVCRLPARALAPIRRSLLPAKPAGRLVPLDARLVLRPPRVNLPIEGEGQVSLE
jgi:hypothetical protein